jgi:hypothetical protein
VISGRRISPLPGHPGQRRDWIKVKNVRHQGVIICGCCRSLPPASTIGTVSSARLTPSTLRVINLNVDERTVPPFGPAYWRVIALLMMRADLGIAWSAGKIAEII